MRVSRFAATLGVAVAAVLSGAGAASAAAPEMAGVYASHHQDGRGSDSADHYRGPDSGYYNRGSIRGDDRRDDECGRQDRRDHRRDDDYGRQDRGDHDCGRQGRRDHDDRRDGHRHLVR